MAHSPYETSSNPDLTSAKQSQTDAIDLTHIPDRDHEFRNYSKAVIMTQPLSVGSSSVNPIGIQTASSSKDAEKRSLEADDAEPSKKKKKQQVETMAELREGISNLPPEDRMRFDLKVIRERERLKKKLARKQKGGHTSDATQSKDDELAVGTDEHQRKKQRTLSINKNDKPVHGKNEKPVHGKNEKPVHENDEKPADENDQKLVDEKKKKPMDENDEKPVDNKKKKPVNENDEKPIDKKPVDEKKKKPMDEKFKTSSRPEEIIPNETIDKSTEALAQKMPEDLPSEANDVEDDDNDDDDDDVGQTKCIRQKEELSELFRRIRLCYELHGGGDIQIDLAAHTDLRHKSYGAAAKMGS